MALRLGPDAGGSHISNVGKNLKEAVVQKPSLTQALASSSRERESVQGLHRDTVSQKPSASCTFSNCFFLSTKPSCAMKMLTMSAMTLLTRSMS